MSCTEHYIKIDLSASSSFQGGNGDWYRINNNKNNCCNSACIPGHFINSNLDKNNLIYNAYFFFSRNVGADLEIWNDILITREGELKVEMELLSSILFYLCFYGP